MDIGKLTELQVKYKKFFVLLSILITFLFLPGYLNLLNLVEPSVEKLLPKNEEVVKNIDNLRNFYDIDAIQLVFKVDDTFEPKFLKYLDILSNYLRSENNVVKIYSLADLVKEKKGYIPDEKEEIKEIVKNDPRLSFLNSYDRQIAVVYIYTDLGSNTWKTYSLLNNVKNLIEESKIYYPFEELKYWITGFPALNIDLFLSIIFDFIKISFLAFLVIFLILLLKFKNIKDVLLTITVIIFPVIWTTGAIGYFGLPLTIVSTVFGAMLMALGISYGINVYNTYKNELERKGNKKEALKSTMNDLTIALIGSSMTTIASFIALLSGILPSYRALGIILTIGIFLVLFYTIFIFPAYIALKEKIE